jgi:signal transduction histidine kinase
VGVKRETERRAGGSPAGNGRETDLISRASLTVRDDGQGIEATLLPRVFDLWVQDENAPVARTGLGLGLHIVKNIVERHGGSVWAESDGSQRGTTFTVRFALHEGSVSGTRAKTTL